MSRKRGNAPLDIQQILAACKGRALRPGEQMFLAEHIASLTRMVNNQANTIARLQQDHAASLPEQVSIRLDAHGAIELEFPGGHSAQIPLGLTQRDEGLAMQVLLRILRERQGQKDRRLAQQGTPTKADLAALAAASSRKPERLPPGKTSANELTLEDLGLDL